MRDSNFYFTLVHELDEAASKETITREDEELLVKAANAINDLLVEIEKLRSKK